MVQKTSMSRGPYPSSQEIPMEVFDPSPQVRCDGRDRGKGPLPWTWWGRIERGRGERGYMPGVEGKRLCAPHPCQ